MIRLFVALRPPAAIRDLCRTAMEGVAGARWQDDAQLHLTLRFIGSVDPHRADDIIAALDTIRADAPILALSGVGCFARDGRAVRSGPG